MKSELCDSFQIINVGDTDLGENDPFNGKNEKKILIGLYLLQINTGLPEKSSSSI